MSPVMLTAQFKIVTPMFIGGAEQSPCDGIRPPSVKSALRFWWRALNWQRFWQEHEDQANALKALHAEEARLFGLAADGKGGGGQGCFLLSVQHKGLSTTPENNIHPNFRHEHLAAARYLGYGLMTAFTTRDRESRAITSEAGQLVRGCINEGQDFTVALTSRKEIDESILNAIKAWGLLGGLGSRSRHGLGSISLEKITCDDKEKWTAPTTLDGYKREIAQLASSLPGVPTPEYSAFSQDCRIDYLLSAESPYEALNEFGNSMLMYRSWGRNRVVLNMPSEERFKNDHDWYRQATTFRRNNPDFHPERVIFGLPHNYHKDSQHHVTTKNFERRASPLLFHVHCLGHNNYLGVGILLKSRFLPDGEKINAGGDLVDQDINWTILTNFLDGNVRFPDKEALLP